MDFVKELYKTVVDTVVPPSTNFFQKQEEAHNPDVRFNLPEDARPPPVYVYESHEAANKAFLNMYWLYMTNYYGREPQFRSDFFVAMFPMDVLNPKIHARDSVRYWWFSLKHPLKRILDNNGAQIEGIFDSEVFGICVVYRDEIIEYCVNWFVDLCNKTEDKRIDADAKSTYSKDRERTNPVVFHEDEEGEDLSGEEDDEDERDFPQQTPVISKKDD